MAKYGGAIAIVLALLIALLLFAVAGSLEALIVNAIVGLAAFWLINHFKLISVPINVLTVLVAALGGLLGVVIVIILAALKVL